MKKLILFLLLFHFLGCLNPQNQVQDNSADKEIFNSNVHSFQTKFIRGFEIEDHALVMSLFADSVKWTGPDKKLLNQYSSYDEISDALKGYLALYEDHSFKNAEYAGGNTFRYEAETSSSPKGVRIYGNWYHTHSESKKEVTHKWFALLRFNKDGKVFSINDFFDVTGFLSQHNEK